MLPCSIPFPSHLVKLSSFHPAPFIVHIRTIMSQGRYKSKCRETLATSTLKIDNSPCSTESITVKYFTTLATVPLTHASNQKHAGETAAQNNRHQPYFDRGHVFPNSLNVNGRAIPQCDGYGTKRSTLYPSFSNDSVLCSPRLGPWFVANAPSWTEYRNLHAPPSWQSEHFLAPSPSSCFYACR
jgi:hypothetical protein